MRPNIGRPGTRASAARSKKPEKSQSTVLTEDLLSIAPELYNGVILRGRSGETIEDSGQDDIDLVDVEGIEISVKASAWDRTPPSEKVAILKKTWDFLTRRSESSASLLTLTIT